MARISLPQKDYDKLKRAVEKFIVSLDGSFEDMQAESKVKSVYRYKAKRWSTMWHGSYSANSAKRMIITNIKKGFKEIGIDVAKASFALKTDYVESVKERFDSDFDEATYFAQWNFVHRGMDKGNLSGSDAVRDFITAEKEFLEGTYRSDDSLFYWDVMDSENA
jgi:hypothetical protein